MGWPLAPRCDGSVTVMGRASRGRKRHSLKRFLGAHVGRRSCNHQAASSKPAVSTIFPRNFSKNPTTPSLGGPCLCPPLRYSPVRPDKTARKKLAYFTRSQRTNKSLPTVHQVNGCWHNALHTLVLLQNEISKVKTTCCRPWRSIYANVDGRSYARSRQG